MIYKYRITGDSGTIFIVGVFPAPRISQQDFKGTLSNTFVCVIVI
jgi:hypothetical protein